MAVIECLGLAEYAFGTVLVDIESENLPAKFAVDDDLSLRLTETSSAAEEQQD